MSPDPSVHEDQLAEIDRTHRQYPSASRRGPGCVSRVLTFIVVLALAIAGLVFWKAHQHGTSASVEADGLARAVTAEGRQLSAKSPDEIIASLRQQVEGLKKNWSNHDQDVEDLRQRVETLRTTISQKKQAAAGLLRTQYQDLRQRAEELAQHDKDQGEKVPAELDELLRTLRPLTGSPAAQTPAEATSVPTPTPKSVEKKP